MGAWAQATSVMVGNSTANCLASMTMLPTG
jgi:hypothetical protein